MGDTKYGDWRRGKNGPGGRDSSRPQKRTSEQANDANLQVPAFGSPGSGWGVSVVVVVFWCLVALSIGVKFADGFWDWLGVLVFGLGVPALVVWQGSRMLKGQGGDPAVPSPRDRERELLAAFSGRGELTAVTAAMASSLTADEASEALEGLLRGGHVRLEVREGVQTYILPEGARRDAAERVRSEDVAASGRSSDEGDYPPTPSEDLSEREMEVLALLASGRTNSEIGSDLFVATGTVKAHVANIYRKLGARNRAEALKRARESKLLP